MARGWHLCLRMQQKPQHTMLDDRGNLVRVVRDERTGHEWRVRATDCQGVPGARSATCLIFDGGTIVRRVWAPPDDWTSCSDAALLALLAGRDD